MDKLNKVKVLKMPTKKQERNYLNRMNMQDARVWFRYRCTNHIKGNKSSLYEDNMQCRLCNTRTYGKL